MQSCLASLFLLACCGSASAAGGFIYFNRIPTLSSPATLHRANPDGSGERLLPVPLPEAQWPAVSRDGRRVLVTSGEPARPFKISDNVFAMNLIHGGIAQVTRFEDSVRYDQGFVITNDLGQPVADRRVTGFTINFPRRKALSPNGNAAVTVNMIVTGTTTTEVPTTNHFIHDPFYLSSGSVRAPVIEAYPVATLDPFPVRPAIFLGAERTGYNQGGDGVDWHPGRDEVVFPARANVPVVGNVTQTRFAEGTVLAVFATSGLNPFIRQLTNPTGIWNAFALPTAFTAWESPHDFAPAISPDGTQVAFVRHTQRADTRISLLPLLALCQIRMINYDGSNDRPVLTLGEGLWVTQLCWAPDGTELAFDLAPQVVVNGFPSLSGDATRSEIHGVRPDGSNPRLLIGGPASFPAWAPAPNAPPADLPVISARLEPDGSGRLRLRPEGILPGNSAGVDVSTDLVNWARAGQLGPGDELTIEPDQAVRFFRLVNLTN